MTTNFLLPPQANNDLHLFKRSPTQLRCYLIWSREIKSKYGGIADFVCQERLHWSSSPIEKIKPVNPNPFADPADYSILRNDWPYGVEPDIAHMVVWLKTAFQTDAEGRVLPESREVIGDFVRKMFVERLKGNHSDAGDRVLWFKNWSALQSVGALEHFHVFVRGAGEDLLKEWTGEGPKMMM